MIHEHCRTLTEAGCRPRNIIGEFQMDGHCCWVVRLDEFAEGVCTASDEGDCAACIEICRFVIDGQPCAILRAQSSPLNGHSDLAALLSARELQIATLVALGFPNKVVATKLQISEWTVATYIRRIFAKLGVETRAAMTFRCATLIEKHRPELFA